MTDCRTIRIPGGHGRAFRVREGGRFSVVDIEGGQVADLIAFCAANPREATSPSHTYTSLKSLRLAVGDAIRSNLRRPLLRIISDTSPSHDLLIPACDEQRYRVDYGVKEHRSCVQNFEEALAEFGIARELFPHPVNLFQYTEIGPHGELIQKPCQSRGGDAIEFVALEDLVVAVSACPMDLNPIGGDAITDIAIQIEVARGNPPSKEPA